MKNPKNKPNKEDISLNDIGESLTILMCHIILNDENLSNSKKLEYLTKLFIDSNEKKQD